MHAVNDAPVRSSPSSTGTWCWKQDSLALSEAMSNVASCFNSRLVLSRGNSFAFENKLGGYCFESLRLCVNWNVGREDASTVKLSAMPMYRRDHVGREEILRTSGEKGKP